MHRKLHPAKSGKTGAIVFRSTFHLWRASQSNGNQLKTAVPSKENIESTSLLRAVAALLLATVLLPSTTQFIHRLCYPGAGA